MPRNRLNRTPAADFGRVNEAIRRYTATAMPWTMATQQRITLGVPQPPPLVPDQFYTQRLYEYLEQHPTTDEPKTPMVKMLLYNGLEVEVPVGAKKSPFNSAERNRLIAYEGKPRKVSQSIEEEEIHEDPQYDGAYQDHDPENGDWGPHEDEDEDDDIYEGDPDEGMGQGFRV